MRPFADEPSAPPVTIASAVAAMQTPGPLPIIGIDTPRRDASTAPLLRGGRGAGPQCALMRAPRTLRAVVLVEGISDQRALEALAARRGRDLEADGLAIVPIGGAQ